MKLSGAVEQACCIVILLAHPDLRSPVTNQRLAKQMGVSPTYIYQSNTQARNSPADYLGEGCGWWLSPGAG